ncbi:hypothetical protein QTP88_000940 [Uroleucon formosanum]
MRDELPIKPRLNECGILNLNNSTQDGSHWVAWKKIKNKKIYFDSFGMPPPPELVKYLGEDNLNYNEKYSDENKGYSYIITVIDTFSKFSWALELKKKDGINVSEAFEKIIKQAISQNHQAPKLLHADKGLEFENKHFKKVLQKYGIKMYHTQNEEKSSIIERFNRILNSKMRLHFEVTNSKKWIKILKSLIYEYNFKDIHRSIGMRPCEVNKSNEDVVFHKLFSTKNKPKLKIKFSVGDRVRITKKTFVKENINNNKMNKKFTYPPKTCDKCNLTVGCKNWAAHLKSIRHQKNDIDQTIVPFRFNKTYKGKPINQEKQKNYNYLKLMQNDIKKSIQKTKCYVKFCAFEYYENSESVKYTLNKIPIEGNIFIISQGDVDFGNGKPYVSKLLHSPTWLELCKIANEQIIATGDYTHHFLEDIKFIQDLGNIKMYEFYMGS